MWEYIVLFILAATPWIEILIVIPIGIAAGLQPVWVAVVTFVGNFLPVLGIIVLHDRWLQWRATRRKKSSDDANQNPERKKSKRRERARRIWNKYGLPGLALAAPAVTGIHLATVMALVFGSTKSNITFWMGISLIIWAVVITLAVYWGFEVM